MKYCPALYRTAPDGSHYRYHGDRSPCNYRGKILADFGVYRWNFKYNTYFGPFIGAIPSVAVALIDSPVKAFWTVVAFLVIQQIDNAFISPKIIEGRLGLHPITTILAVWPAVSFSA